MRRDAALQAFLDRLDEGFAAAGVWPEAAAMLSRVRGALATPGTMRETTGSRRPVCDVNLPDAYARARRHSPPIARLVDAFAAIEPRLVWTARPRSGPHASANWPDGHANAMIAGPGGAEARSDVWVGASLLAPNVRYPDHDHAPEEVYLVLSPGRFRHGSSNWFEPGVGGWLHNTPGVRHAMASDGAPLLAI